MWVLDHFRPSWPGDVVHESSPGNRGASVRLSAQCSAYVSSQFFSGVPSGQRVQQMRCENLEAMSFSDASVDVHVTQDVLEHVFDPDAVFREIARTLVPGGMHIFTTPLVNKHSRTERAASLVNGEIVHHLPPEYHGNPVSAEGSLVTMRWGYDITEHIARASGLSTQLVYLDALELGIRAEYIEVLITRKPAD
jgi:SAM-dependent methyltransferase